MKKIIFLLIVLTSHLYTLNYYPQFYLPRTFCGEPRLEQPALTTFEIILRGGHALHGYDCIGNQVNPLAIYGYENLQYLTKNVPTSILNCNPDCLLNALWEHTTYNQNFGKLAANGTYSSAEFLSIITQNFTHGFFASLSIPIKKNTIKDIRYTELGARSSLPTDIDFISWQATTNSIESTIGLYGVHIGRSKICGLGDIQLIGGWTLNYEDIRTLDYIDCMLALGVNFATSKHSNCTYTWCLPLGYEGHTGFPFIAAASVGIFDWFTIGIQTGALWFVNKTRPMAIKTAEEQSGWIRLARIPTCVHKGTIWHIDEYLKFDHMFGGFSLYFGFEHDHANRTHITFPYSLENIDLIVSNTIANSDERLMPWAMTTFNFALEFDFATFDHPNLPRLTLTIDKSIHGKRILETLLTGAYLGVDLEW